MFWILLSFTNLNEYLLDRGLGLVAKGTDWELYTLSVVALDGIHVYDYVWFVCQVLHWSHNLQSPPQYLDVVCHNTLISTDDVLLVGSQETAELYAFQFNVSTPTVPPIATDRPWKMSRMRYELKSYFSYNTIFIYNLYYYFNIEGQ